MSFWVRIPLLTLVVLILISVGFCLVISLTLVRRRRELRSERGSLALARKCAGREGEIVQEGVLRFWYSRSENPVPSVLDQMQIANRRFETLLGGVTVVQRPLRIFVFDDRGAFLRFHMRFLPGYDLTDVDSVYLGHPYGLATLCTAPAVGRITDSRWDSRSLAAFSLLESVWGPGATLAAERPQQALARFDDHDALSRLNRKMVAAIHRETALSSELFTLSLKELGRLMMGSQDPTRFQKLRQFQYQSWSVVEYLVGERSPRTLREALGAFLRDPRSKTAQEESFCVHFGRDYETLLDGWREWVLAQGIGTHEPPPDFIRDGLLLRLLPVVRDQTAKRGDRITAIRDWANLGFVLGADHLIDLLRQPDEIPLEEITWALEMVSGMPWGNEPFRWQSWWDDLVRSGVPCSEAAGGAAAEMSAAGYEVTRVSVSGLPKSVP